MTEKQQAHYGTMLMGFYQEQYDQLRQEVTEVTIQLQQGKMTAQEAAVKLHNTLNKGGEVVGGSDPAAECAVQPL